MAGVRWRGGGGACPGCRVVLLFEISRWDHVRPISYCFSSHEPVFSQISGRSFTVTLLGTVTRLTHALTAVAFQVSVRAERSHPKQAYLTRTRLTRLHRKPSTHTARPARHGHRLGRRPRHSSLPSLGSRARAAELGEGSCVETLALQAQLLAKFKATGETHHLFAAQRLALNTTVVDRRSASYIHISHRIIRGTTSSTTINYNPDRKVPQRKWRAHGSGAASQWGHAGGASRRRVGPGDVAPRQRRGSQWGEGAAPLVLPLAFRGAL